MVNLTDASGVKVASYNYKAFGQMRSQSGAVSNAWLFTGRQFDAESGLYFNRNRFYDARIGRFITQDPSLRFGARSPVPYLLLTHLNDPRQLHSYLYCINSPVNLRDPMGLTAWQSIFTPTPERVMRWIGRTLSELGYTWTGRITGAIGAAIEPGGTGKMTGMIAGGTLGAAGGATIGSAFPGPGTVIGGIVGGIAGGIWGGWFGSQFDYSSAGYLNYNEWEGYNAP